jgi:hypothetical protein
LNTALYKLKNIGFDITVGENDYECESGGFPASEGNFFIYKKTIILKYNFL